MLTGIVRPRGPIHHGRFRSSIRYGWRRWWGFVALRGCISMMRGVSLDAVIAWITSTADGGGGVDGSIAKGARVD